MAKILEYRDISLDELVIGMGQVRTQSPGKGIDDLVRSIETQGLLQPIVVCPARDEDKWEILVGQRRFLAHKLLKREAIAAAVLDERVSSGEAKAISITENLIRRQLSGKELKDGILYLYKLYGSIQDVVEATGLPRGKVRDNIKYPRLIPELKKLVDDGRVDVNAAVKAQDAATDETDTVNSEFATTLALEMEPMTGVQRKRVTKVIKARPKRRVEDVIEDAKTGSQVTQIVATVTVETHSAIQRYAREEGTNQDEAVASLIEEALIGRGLLEE